ncbi:MltR family transcriptional regulator [Vibrio sonorensis]|uniref:MltR family transcriptional regulator n=1 Tax=Vibrio sonorensis TaxID=1004316 RepID=UPI0008D97F72|nr:MltR family transcriptional regulator [Vibrio sonorensis]
MAPSIIEFWEQERNESDRSLSISGAAIIDQQLKELLESYFIVAPKETKSLFSSTGALGALGVRNQIAYVIGLIDKTTYLDIRLIQKIRNKFAHSHLRIDFSEPKVSGLASSLEIPQWVGEPGDNDPESPRGMFFSGVRGVLWHLVTEQARLKKEGRRQSPEGIFPFGGRSGIEFNL